MGNVASCAPSIISGNSAVKVLMSDGRLGVFSKPVSAAELMLENPGQFVCDAGHLKVGHRIPGLLADEELEPNNGQLYYLLPIELLYSVLTTEEMCCLTDQASRALKHGISKLSKIFPALGDFRLRNSGSKKHSENPATQEEENDGDIFAKQRSWRPALETIVETPPHAARIVAGVGDYFNSL